MPVVNTVLFVGKPGAGKGTQATLLAETHGWEYCATGDRFRELAQRKDALGERIGHMLATGQLLHDAFITELLFGTLLRVPPHQGIVFDGFARTEKQAREFRDALDLFGRPFMAVHLIVEDEEARERMRQRAERERRVDSDSLTKIDARLAEFQQLTMPAIRYLSDAGKLAVVGGSGAPPEVHRAIIGCLCGREQVLA